MEAHLIVYQILSSLILLVCLTATNSNCAQLINQESPILQAARNAPQDKTADLTLLINETLAINNRTLANPDKLLVKDEWTFDMVEYDLMEFLQDLSARYKLNNNSNYQSYDSDSILEGKRTPVNENKVSTNLDTSSTSILSAPVNEPTQDKPAKSPSHSITPIPEISTSLASGDHDIGESSWQYGIFDRFTRPKSTTTTSSPSIDTSLIMDSNGKYNLKQFNSDECGLRTYDEARDYYPQQFDSPADLGSSLEALNSRRHKLPTLPSLASYEHRKYQLESELINEQRRQEEREKEAYNSFRQNVDRSSLSSNESGGDIGGEFNLSSRRQWLQQQLGNTLQMLGFNSSIQADFFNQTSGSNLNMRENMMKKSGKFGKSSSLGFGQPLTEDLLSPPSNQKLLPRQDDLNLEARVIGGNDARLGDSPWSVSLQALVSRPGTGAVEYRHYCGGTIISEHYILTAAHCLDFMVGRESRLFVVVGDLNWRMSAASLYGRRFGIEKLIIHSGYKSTAFGHDIGLIKTKESMKPLKVNGKYIINSVCLPEKGVEHSGEAELVGWGLFSNRNEMADSLQIADVPILPRPLCVDLYRRRTGLIQWLIGIELITEKQVCAGTFGRGICQGDSGSALVYNEKIPGRQSKQLSKILRTNSGTAVRDSQTRATIIGIVAFGGIRRCSYQSLPGVYMQTSKYLDWILPRIQP